MFAAKPARTHGRAAAAARDRNQSRGPGRATARRQQDHGGPTLVHEQVDEKAKSSYFESAFSDAIAIYMLAITIDFDYTELREREYPLLAAPALAERLRHVAGLFPANPGYEIRDSVSAPWLTAPV